MPVNSIHPDYQSNLDDWLRVRAAVSGKKALLKKFLRKPDPDDKKRQKDYEDGAVYQNWTGRTRNGLLGAVFRENSTVDLPESIQSLIDEADQFGNTLDQFARSVVDNTLSVGRHGLLLDYPEVASGLTVAQIRAQNIKPIICEYVAESIINWRTDGGELILVVLHEAENVAADEFDYKYEDRYRVLRMVEGAYVQELYNSAGQIIETKEPKQANGASWDFIPFIAVGSVNNDINIDEIPLLPLADLGIAAFRNSADYEEGVFVCGQPMLHINIGDMSSDTWAALNPEGVRFGSRRGLTTQNGSADLLQSAANTAASEAINMKSEQAVQLGARLIDSKSSNQTAEAARIEAASEHSALDLVVGNCSSAIKQMLQWACLFTGDNPDAVEYELNRSFFDESVNPQMLMAAIQLNDRQVLRRIDLVELAKKAKLAPHDEESEAILEGAANEAVL